MAPFARLAIRAKHRISLMRITRKPADLFANASVHLGFWSMRSQVGIQLPDRIDSVSRSAKIVREAALFGEHQAVSAMCIEGADRLRRNTALRAAHESRT